jgi:DNA polymerase-1
MPWNISIPDAECFTLKSPVQPGTLSQEVIVASRSDQIEALVAEALDQDEIAIDTETTGLSTWKDMPIFWSLSWGERRICMPGETMHYFDAPFRDPSKKWIFANAKFDAHMLANVGVNIAGKLVDTQVMHALLYEEQSHRLKDMAKNLLGWRWTDFGDTFGSFKENGPEYVLRKMWAENPSKLIDYASNDAYGTYKIYLKLKQELEEAKTHSLYPDRFATLADIFWKIEVPFTRVLFSCERHGVKIDVDYLEKIKGPMQQELTDIEWEINKHVGKPLNPNSPKQLRDYLIGERGLQPITYTKGGKSGVKEPSVDAGFLEHYEKEDPVAALCLRHRDLAKTLGTYVEGLQTRLDSHQRVHTRFNQDVARTGRLSSSDPNLQNIPKPESDRFKLRGAFVPEEGNDLIVIDYEQLEMRLLAAAAGEADMIDIIRKGWDIHMGNAALVFGPIVARQFGHSQPYEYDDFKKAKQIDKEVKAGKRPISDMTDEIHALLKARDAAKTIGFGLNYGMKENKLAARLGCTKQEALTLMQQYMARYPAVDQFFKQSVEDTRQTGYSFTVLGRRRFLPEIMSMNDMDRWQAERQAGNTEIQGSAADVAKMAMILVHEDNFEARYDCRMLIQVHDELMFECPKQYSQQVRKELVEWMEHPLPSDLSVPLSVSAGIGKNWMEAK